MDQSSNSELIWMSTVMHETEYEGKNIMWSGISKKIYIGVRDVPLLRFRSDLRQS